MFVCSGVGWCDSRKEIPGVQCPLTGSDLSLQAATGLMSYLEIGVRRVLDFKMKTGACG